MAFQFIAVLAAAGAGILAPAAQAACPGEAVRSQFQTEAQLADSVLCLINEQRAAFGLAPVVPNRKLETAALGHSRDMVANGYFAHTSPDGVDFVTRIVDTGYIRGAKGWLVGENLAWGSGYLSTPLELMRTWMESPPHRANLLRGRFREIGIAAVRGTPQPNPVLDGITVTSEYGFRSIKKRSKAGAARKRSQRRR